MVFSVPFFSQCTAVFKLQYAISMMPLIGSEQSAFYLFVWPVWYWRWQRDRLEHFVDICSSSSDRSGAGSRSARLCCTVTSINYFAAPSINQPLFVTFFLLACQHVYTWNYETRTHCYGWICLYSQSLLETLSFSSTPNAYFCVFCIEDCQQCWNWRKGCWEVSL